MLHEDIESSELEEVVERAHDELPEQEFERKLHHAEEIGQGAGWRTVRHWIFWLAMGAIVVASALGDVAFALLAPVLLVFYVLPYVLAAKVTAQREEEKQDLVDAIREHEDSNPKGTE